MNRHAKSFPLPRALLLLALALALCLALPATPARAASYYQEALDQLVEWGVLNGYPDGSLRADSLITRAEFVAMVNRAYGFKEKGQIPFTDVPESSWFYDDISIAYKAKYFNGTSATTASPQENLTREQAMVLLALNMRLEPSSGEVNLFADSRDFGKWSRDYVNVAAEKGLISGYPDGTFRPKNKITRGEMAVMLRRALGNLVNREGEYTLGEVYGNVTVSGSGTILRDTNIAGDLYISGGLGLGGVILENTNVLGEIIVAGGGAAEGGESIIMRNVTADNLKIDSLPDQYVSVRAEGDTLVPDTSVRTDAFIQDRTETGQGLLNISLDSPGDGNFTLSGNLENVVNNSPDSKVQISRGTVKDLRMDENGSNADLQLDDNATVRTLNLDTATKVTGTGDVEELHVNTPGSTTEMLPDVIDIRPGVTADISGTEMDSSVAEEASTDPRLLAGFPKISVLAPTSGTVLFQTNKAGTIYWGITNLTDGSVDEEILITPVNSSRLQQSGNLEAAASNTNYTADFKDLTPGGSYYLSALLVDVRGSRSPVKVISFTAPDDSVPDFAKDYPYMSKITSTTAQVAVMATKSCDLYYALLPKGGAQPSTMELLSAAVSGNLGYGVLQVERNMPIIFYCNSVPLEELVEYDLYLWLNDADNAKSSKVQKLSFITVDETPPVFNTEPTVTARMATSLRLVTNLNEDGTVYWVIVRHGTDYPNPPPTGAATTADQFAQIQIVNGQGSISAGRPVNVKANVDASFTISGLAPATAYDIWFIARDKAGNYSTMHKEGATEFTNFITDNTLDITAPTARLEFTRYSGDESDVPFATTDAHIIFSEAVESTYENDARITFSQLYNDVKNAQTAEDLYSARFALAEALRNCVKLYNTTGNMPVLVTERTEDTSGSDWTIDYRKVIITQDPETGEMLLDFRNDEALNLSSGSSYYFQLENIADVSSNRNRMGRIRLPATPSKGFTTISAQVALSPLNVTSIVDPDDAGSDLEIDMAFTMTPISTNVEDAIDFDVLFWSDSSVAFRVYELKSDGEGNYAVDRRAGYNPVEIVNDNSASDGYIGRSLYRDFYGMNSNPQLNSTLKDDVPRHYGIHFTSVNHVDEGSDGKGRRTWNQSVNYRISVVTGSSASLGNLARNVTEKNLAEYVKDWGVSEIQQPKPFPLRAEFTNQNAPEFYSDYPQFTEVLDTTMTMRVMLDRPGTLYYAIAPVSINNGVYSPALPTTLSDGSTISPNSVSLIPENGSDYRAPRYLLAPAPYNIYNPNFGNDAIKTGSIELGTGYSEIQTDDLMPNTLYFVYYVMQGTGQVYSDQVQIFQFTTEEVNRPKLVLQQTGSYTVTVESRNMNATGSYAIFSMDGLPEVLKGKVGNHHINAEDYDSQYDEYTIWEALATPMQGGGSLFDQFVDEQTKQELLNIIQGKTTDITRIGSTDNVSLTRGKADRVDCSDYGIQTIMEYIFVAAARSNMADDSIEANAYGFSAAQPIYIRDTTPPQVVTLTGQMEVTYRSEAAQLASSTGNYVMSGNIYLTFDKDIYLYQNATTRDPFTRDNMKSFQQLDGYGNPIDSSGAVLGTGSNGSPIITKIEPTDMAATGDSQNVNTVTISVSNAREGDYFLTNPNLVSLYSSPNVGNPLRLSLSYNAEDKKVYVTISPSDIWYEPGTTELNTTVITPVLTQLTVSPSSLNMYVGDVTAVTVGYLPVGAYEQVSWKLDNDNAILNAAAGGTVNITAKRVGTAVLTVTSQSGVTATCPITINPIPVANITLKRGTATVSEVQLAGAITITAEVSSGREEPPANYNVDVKAEGDYEKYINIITWPHPGSRTTEFSISRKEGTEDMEFTVLIRVSAADGNGAVTYLTVNVVKTK